MAAWIRSGLVVTGIFGAAVAAVALLTVQASHAPRLPRHAAPHGPAATRSRGTTGDRMTVHGLPATPPAPWTTRPATRGTTLRPAPWATGRGD